MRLYDPRNDEISDKFMVMHEVAENMLSAMRRASIIN